MSKISTGNEQPAGPAITRDMLREATNSRYFQRGEGYFDAGRVRSMKQKDGTVYATVDGSRAYKTTLWATNGVIGGACTCPLGRDGEFCKHLVATGLAWMESDRSPDGKVQPQRIEPNDIEVWLRKQSPERLVETLMAQALNDDTFYNMLKFRVAADQPAANVSEMRAVLQQAMEIDGFVSWREASTYARGVERVIERIKAMAMTHPSEVVELAEYALELWEEAIECIDSDGEMGMILDDLKELHLDACNRAKPDPEALAIRLFHKHINSGWDLFDGAYETYEPALGPAGKAAYRKLAEKAWQTLPRIAPGEKDSERPSRSRKLEALMRMFAEEAGDLKTIVAIMGRDLSEPYGFLNIAERCRKARKYKLALEWAEKGVKAFPNHYDMRLPEFLADAYLRAKRPDDALDVIWKIFSNRPGLDRYKCLAQYAEKVGAWPIWREKALTHMRAETLRLKKEALPRQYPWQTASDGSMLVEVFLWEKDVEAAWAEARNDGCSESLWLQLAKLREKTHPSDAVAIYRRQIEPLLRRKNNPSYQEAVEFLARIHNLMRDMGKETDFKRDLQAIKTEWKRLRNFIEYVEQRPWGK